MLLSLSMAFKSSHRRQDLFNEFLLGMKAKTTSSLLKACRTGVFTCPLNLLPTSVVPMDHLAILLANVTILLKEGNNHQKLFILHNLWALSLTYTHCVLKISLFGCEDGIIVHLSERCILVILQAVLMFLQNQFKFVPPRGNTSQNKLNSI